MVGRHSLTGPRDPDPAFQESLLSCGVVTALTTACRALSQSDLPGAGIELKGFLTAIVDHMSLFPSVWLPQSLRAGLLDILFTSRHRKIVNRTLINLVKHVIFPATVSHSVLAQLQTSLSQVRDRDAKAIFRHTGLLTLWMNLIEVVESRFRILAEYHTGMLTAARASDDLECAKIRPKSELKRCSGCLAAYYCSGTCQANDWMRGGHRKTCDGLSLRREEFSHPSSRDRSFLRLVHHEWMTRREEIAQQHLLSEQIHPSEVLCTVLDFTAGIEVGPLDSSVRSRFEFDIDRVMRSGGRMELQLLKVMDSRQSRMWPFLL
ncbi:MYND-type domain-containing protein [Mycena sanguinolenta]|uniref:MYND-type domain-containing protein n=1 Tax=Mycena sanguinolenta TaxID=230812 RepID=A0A8H7D115_9AGAR|nr:MYND-type domain-containing protein [Mycena sanguinolenta]